MDYLRTVFFRLIFGVALIGLIVWWVFTPDSGERELRRSQAALAQAMSWREKTTVRTPTGAIALEMDVEIACPERGHWLERHPSAGYSDEYITAGQRGYTFHDGRWQTGGGERTLPCAKAARGLAFPFADFEKMIEASVITKNDVETVQGTECREWTIHLVHGLFTQNDPDERICIGTEDHLPRRIRTGGIESVFYGWNEFIKIDEPDATPSIQ